MLITTFLFSKTKKLHPEKLFYAVSISFFCWLNFYCCGQLVMTFFYSNLQLSSSNLHNKFNFFVPHIAWNNKQQKRGKILLFFFALPINSSSICIKNFSRVMFYVFKSVKIIINFAISRERESIRRAHTWRVYCSRCTNEHQK